MDNIGSRHINHVCHQPMSSKMLVLIAIVMATVDRRFIGGNLAAAAAEQTDVDQLTAAVQGSEHVENSPHRSSSSKSRSAAADPFDRYLDDGIQHDDGMHQPMMMMTSLTSSDRQMAPESRRAASFGLRLIGLGKRPSSSGSALKYIGLGRKRTPSAIKYIGLGKREDYDDGDVGSSSAAYDEGVVGEHRLRLTRRRRDARLRLIGLGRRSSSSADFRHHQLNNIDDDDNAADDFDAELSPHVATAVARQPWQQHHHQVKRRSGGGASAAAADGLFRRMQLRRVDPALLLMGIGK